MASRSNDRKKRRGRRKAVVLFSGIGGGTLGLQRSGCDVVLAVDIDPWANRNHERLTGFRPVCADLLRTPAAELMAAKGLDPEDSGIVILASPPCEGITTAGRCDPGDPRNSAFGAALDAAEGFPAATLVIENVAALASKRFSPLLDYVLSRLRSMGRRVPDRKALRERWLLDARDFGVPSRRLRVFLVAPPPGVDLPQPPTGKYAEKPEGGREPWRSINDAIGNGFVDPDPRFMPLPSPQAVAYGRPQSRWTREYRRNLSRRYSRSEGCYFRLPDASKPSVCVLGYTGISTRGFGVHPDGNRFYSIGELMALMALPLDRGPVVGKTTHCWDMVADAICPAVAEAVGRASLGMRQPKVSKRRKRIA